MTSNYKILLIEDNTDMRENIAEILMLSGYQTIEAENGKVGVIKAIAELPDLIICDVMMPIMDGFEALYILEKNDKTKHIPFIFLTAKSENQDVRAGMNLGADDFLTKPFEEIDLLKAVETRLTKHENKQQHIDTNSSSILSVDDVNALLCSEGVGEIKNYKRKDVVFYEKDDANALYWVKEGSVRLFKEHPLGKDFTTSIINEKTVLGLTAVYANTKFSQSAVCMDNTVCVKIPKNKFLELVKNDSCLQNYFFTNLAESHIKKETSLVDLAYNSVKKRVADSLLLLDEKFNLKSLDSFSIYIPRDELATMVGTSPESVIRVLSNFKSDKIIEIHGSEISILDKNKLREVYH